MNVVRQLGKFVATNHQAQTVTAFAKTLILTFVNKRVIRAAARTDFLRRFLKPIPVEVHVPLLPGCRFCIPLGCVRGHAVPGFLFRKLHSKAEWLAFGREADQGFMRVTFLEVPYPPRVGGEDFFLQDSAEFLFPAAF